MLKNVKSLVAVALALLATTSAGGWLAFQARRLQGRREELLKLQRQIAAIAFCPKILEQGRRQLDSVRQETEQLIRRLATPNQEEAELMGALSRAAAAAGVDLAQAARVPRSPAPGMENGPLRITTHRFLLSGRYPDMIGFFRNLDTWDRAWRIEHLDMRPPDESDTSGRVHMELTLSVFSPCGRN